MKSEHQANTSLAQMAEAIQAERAEWAKKLAPVKKQVQRPAPAKTNFFCFLFKLA